MELCSWICIWGLQHNKKNIVLLLQREKNDIELEALHYLLYKHIKNEANSPQTLKYHNIF